MTARTDIKRHSIVNQPDDRDPKRRVGARQRKMDTYPEGGGYLDNCIYSEISSGEKKTATIILSELKEMGLRDDLLMMAEKVGADKFVQIWQQFDSLYDGRNVGRFRVSFPSFKKYLKYQRNEFIREKANQGLPAVTIQRELYSLGFIIPESTVRRLCHKFKRVSPDLI